MKFSRTVIPYERGDKALDTWQKRVCDNRYFPATNRMITGKCNYNCLHCFNTSDNASVFPSKKAMFKR